MGGFGFKFGPYEMRTDLKGLGNTLQEERDKFIQDKVLKLYQLEHALESAPQAAFQTLPAFGVAAGPFSLEKASPSSLGAGRPKVANDSGYLVTPKGLSEARSALDSRRGPQLPLPWTEPTVPAQVQQEAPSVPGRITRGPNGEILLTNIPGVGRELAMAPTPHLPVGERIGGGGSLQSGAIEQARVRAGAGGFMESAPRLTSLEQAVDPNVNPILQQEWVDRNMKVAPIQALQAELGLKGAEAELARRQADLQGAQAERLRESPEERAVAQSQLPLMDYVQRNQDKYQAILKLYQARALLSLMAERGFKTTSDVPVEAREQLAGQAEALAIRQFVLDNSSQLQLAMAREGMLMNPYSTPAS